MAEQFSISDDMLNFAQKLDQDNFNVKSYRKRTSQSHHKKQVKNNQSAENFHLHLQHHKDQSHDKTPRTTDVLSTRRFSSTAGGVRKRSKIQQQLSFVRTGRNQLLSGVDDPSELGEQKDMATVKWDTPRNGRFSQKQKQLAKKGPLQNKHFQEWLNHALIQTCRDQKFDRTIEHPALKKYGIDKNSLLSKGVNPENINRIFKALFVYSMGFNTLLKQIGGNQIRKALWKVYAILLQYCSDGDFQTMIGQIERDKVAKTDLLRVEIERRQQIIDNNEQIHQEKNAKIFKELKQLREANMNLENDKQVLMEDYKEAQQAFNEEVSLRLKFQNKINQIHGVHHQLTIKHQKLYDDLQLKKYHHAELTHKHSQLSNNYIKTKNDLEEQMRIDKTIKVELDYCKQETEMFRQKQREMELKEIESHNKMQELMAVIHEKERKVEQIDKELKNTELMFKLKDQSQKSLQGQYQRSLQQNKQLVNSLQSQLENLNQYMQEKKEFNNTHSRLYAELSISNSTLVNKQQEIAQSRKLIRELNFLVNQKDIQTEEAQSKNQRLQADLNDLFIKIDEMKKVKNAFEEENFEVKNKLQTYKNYFAKKEIEIAEMTQKIDDLQRRVSEFNITKRTLDSKIALLNQKMTSDQQMYKKKLSRLEQQLKVVEKQRKELREQIQVRRADSTKYLLLYEESMSKIKDHLFERNDLELKYSQSLSVVENETDHIKKLNIRISELQQKNEDIIREIKGCKFIMEGKQKTFKMELQIVKQTLQQFRIINKDRKNYVHPMMYQEALAAAITYEGRISALKEKIKTIQMQSKQYQLTETIDKLAKQLQREKLICQQEVQLKDKELFQYRNKVEEMQKQVKNKGKQVGQQKGGDQFKAKELKYLEFIKQKSNKIEQLLKEIQKMQDTNSHMITQIDNLQLQVKEKQQYILKVEKEKKQNQHEKKTIEEQRNQILKEKQKISQLVREAEKKASEQREMDVTLEGGLERDSKSRQRGRGSSSEEERRKREQRQQWRSNFTKKVKNATNYYHK